MCGILGQLYLHSFIDISNFNQALQTLSSRGPDGLHTKYLNNNKVGLGHARLAIIDLSEKGNQPISNEDGTLWLVFNGEIYNYKDLKKKLQNLGHVFYSNADSEVIIHAYEEWGTNCVKILRGIFAFGIYSTLSNEIFLARDHVGVKPLYYYKDELTFIFASEPKAIIKFRNFQRSLNHDALNLYLTFGNVPGKYSIFKGIFKLLPGHYLKLDANHKINISQYWVLRYDPIIKDYDEAKILVTQKLNEAIDLQTISDVPLGSLLSGGIDSTIITGKLCNSLNYRLSTFNIGFDDKISDESQFAKLIAEYYSTVHNHREINAEIALSDLVSLIDIFDEPFHLNGLFPYLQLSKLVKSHNYKVVMGGDGADELFCGYLWYDKVNEWNKQNKSTFRQNINNLIKGKSVLKTKFVQFYLNFNTYLSEYYKNELFGFTDRSLVLDYYGHYFNSKLSPELNAQIIDFNCFMVDHCLTKVDRTSMSQGVEVRVPFLDIELIDLIFSIDHSLIYRKGERKALLKNAFHQFLPKQMNTVRKKGFSSPIEKWMKSGLGKKGFYLLMNGSLIQHNLINSQKVLEHYDSVGDYNQMMLIGLELWSRKWLDNESINSSLSLS